ncbi:MAG: hypothetical protein RLZZ461_1011, partial [Planctomycetota bacterium]
HARGPAHGRIRMLVGGLAHSSWLSRTRSARLLRLGCAIAAAGRRAGPDSDAGRGLRRTLLAFQITVGAAAAARLRRCRSGTPRRAGFGRWPAAASNPLGFPDHGRCGGAGLVLSIPLPRLAGELSPKATEGARSATRIPDSGSAATQHRSRCPLSSPDVLSTHPPSAFPPCSSTPARRLPRSRFPIRTA